MSNGIPIPRLQAEQYVEQIRRSHSLIVPCGSYRRKADTSNDLDIAVLLEDGDGFHELALQIAANLGATIQRGGNSLVVMHTPAGHQIDLYRTEPWHEGAMVLFLTGSAQFNIKMRAKAKRMGYRLNQYGLWSADDSRAVCSAVTEDSIFAALNLTFVQPENR